MIRIAICDDNRIFTSDIEKLLIKVSKEHGIDVDINIFYSGNRLLQYYEENSFDLLYLDIEMDNGNGIDTARSIRRRDSKIFIIYISAYDDYVTNLFDIQPFRFIDKPICANTINSSFLQVCDKIEKNDLYYEYSYKKTIYKVPISSIKYFTSIGRKIYIIDNHSACHEFYGKLNEIELFIKNRKLRFLRIHHSYLVNFNFIQKLGYTSLQLTDGEILKISLKKQKMIREEYISLLKDDPNYG